MIENECKDSTVLEKNTPENSKFTNHVESTNLFLKLVEETKKANLNVSFCTISSDIEKNLDSLIKEKSECSSELSIDGNFDLNTSTNKTIEINHITTKNIVKKLSCSSGSSEDYDEVQDFTDINAERYLKRFSGISGNSNESIQLSTGMPTRWSSSPQLDKVSQEKNLILNSVYDPYFDNDSSDHAFSLISSNASPIRNRSYNSSKIVNVNHYNNIINNSGYINTNTQHFSPPVTSKRNPKNIIIPPFSLNLNSQETQNSNRIQNKNLRSAFNLNPILHQSKHVQFNIPQNNQIQSNQIHNYLMQNYQMSNYQIQSNSYQNSSQYQNNQIPSNLTAFKSSFNEVNKKENYKNTVKSNLLSSSLKNSNNNSTNNFLYDDIYILENILNLLKDQNGCRIIQLKLNDKVNDLNYISLIYEKLKTNLIEIINDQFGNYVIQKYLEIIRNDKLLINNFFEFIRNYLYDISVNNYGTRFFQRSLEIITPIYSKIETDNLNAIFREIIEQHILDLISDTNGNHVFQKILILYPKNKNQFIYDALCKICYEVSKMKQGGCIFAKAFDYASTDQEKQLVVNILSHFNKLINNEYGNFIIQQIVFLKNCEFNDMFFNVLKENLGPLSKKKFSSNAIDKCIIMEDNENKNKLRIEIINTLLENKLIAELICDQYGNYVIQKALQVSDGLKFMEIIHAIKPAVKILKQSSHGRKIYENLIIQYGDYFQQNVNKYNNLVDGRRISHMMTYSINNKLEK